MIIRKYKLLIAIMSLLSILGCSDDEMTRKDARWCEVEASFDETLTRVGLSTMENSRNLVAKWQEGDQMNVILCANDKYYEVGPVPVREISDDGRSCKFSYRLPDGFNEPSDGYQLMCFTSNCQPKIIDDEVYYNGSLIRKPLSQFKASVMSDEHVSSGVFQSNFRHYCAYELLHVFNKSDKDIDFSVCGYSADAIWYRTLCAVRNWDGKAVYPSEAAQPAVEESPTLKIPANGSDIIVSSFIPNGQLINNAKLAAKINGEYVHSSNTLSSDVTLQRGHAYHMYATWDGKELKFDSNDQKELELSTYTVECNIGLPVSIKNNSAYWDTRLEVSDETIISAEHYYYDKRSIIITPFRAGQAKLSIIDINTGKKSTVDVNVAMPLLPEEYVDLGLPSGTLWAISNLGSQRNGYPDVLFAWGELWTKKTFSADNYSPALMNRTTDLTDDLDVAYVASEGKWRIPTEAELKELFEECSWGFQSPYLGMIAYGPNGNILKLDVSIVKATYYAATDYHSSYWSRDYVNGLGIPCLNFLLYTHHDSPGRWGSNSFEYELNGYEGKLIRPVLNQ